MSQGATLLTIKSQQKQETIETLFKNKSVWLALFDSKDNGRFGWKTPESETSLTLTYKNWANVQGYPGSRCGKTVANNMKWRRFPCNSTAEVVCEKTKTG